MIDDKTIIPGFSAYTITKSGKIYSKLTNKTLSGSVNNRGYLNFRLKSNNGKTRTVGLHRLLALTYILDSRNTKDLIVNHKDGDKTNNDLSNLEWVTYTENTEHAGDNMLTSKCVPVEFKDFKTNEIKSFPSAVKCAEYLGVSKDYILHRIKFPNDVFKDLRQYRRKYSKVRWHDKLPCKLNTGNSKTVLLMNYKDNNVRRYDSLSDFSVEYNMLLSVVSTMLSKHIQPMVSEYEQIKLDDGNKWLIEKHPKEAYLLQGSDTRAIIIVDGDKKYYYGSLADCSRNINVKITTLSYRLKKYNGKKFKDGKYYMYLSEFIKGPFS